VKADCHKLAFSRGSKQRSAEAHFWNGPSSGPASCHSEKNQAWPIFIGVWPDPSSAYWDCTMHPCLK